MHFVHFKFVDSINLKVSLIVDDLIFLKYYIKKSFYFSNHFDIIIAFYSNIHFIFLPNQMLIHIIHVMIFFVSIIY
jgi:hypothetical protein